MAGFGAWSSGPIQFNHNSGAIEGRGTIDTPPPSAASGPSTPTPAPSPGGGGVLPYGGGPNPEWGMPSGAGASGFGGGAASNTGGSYGLGGGGGLDGQGQGLLSFDDGGAVPDDDSDGSMAPQGAQAATVDPMAMVKQALQYGRKKMGLPTNFTTGQSDQTQSFDDGGMVDDQESNSGVIQQPQAQPGGGGMPDPRKAMSYLSGAGNVSPDIADALEKKIDPQGMMNPSERTVKAITAAPSPEAQFGLMQHYRTRYNAYAGGARAAFDQGNLAQAAAHATKAFQNVPTGYSLQFAPTQGGMAVRAQKSGQQPQQPAMEDGGMLEGEPESDNIEDRREQDNSVTTPQALAQAEENKRKGQHNAGFNPLASDLDDQGYKPKSLAFDDGGEVPQTDGDDEEAEGVLDNPTEEAEEAPAEPQAPAQDEPPAEPVVLNRDQFHNLMQSGYDKPLDEGVGGFLNSILNAINPISPAQAGEAQPQGGQPAGGAQGGFRPGSMFDKLDGWMKGRPSPAAPDVTAAVTDDQPQGPQDPRHWQPTPSIMNAARNQPGQQSGMQESTVGKTNSFDSRDRQPQEQQPPQPQQPQGRTGDQRMDAYKKRIQKLADELYPTAGQTQQRTQYVASMMAKVMDSEGRIDQENARNRGGLQSQREKAALDRDTMKELMKNGRQENGAASKERIAADNRAWNNLNRQQQDAVRLAGQQLAADPSLANDPQKLQQRVTQIGAKFGIDPQTALSLLQNGGPAGGAQPQQQQGQPKQGGAMTIGGVQYKYSNGQLYKRGPNGEAVPVQMPQ